MIASTILTAFSDKNAIIALGGNVVSCPLDEVKIGSTAQRVGWSGAWCEFSHS
jgi:hypothetical protein